MSRKSRRRARIEAAKSAPPAPRKPREQLGEFRFVAATAKPAAIRAAEGEGKKLPSFSGVAYTGAPMTLGGWWTPVIVALDGVKVPSQHRPVLRQHDFNRIVGHTDAVTVDAKDGITIEGPMSGVGPDKDEVCQLAANGFQWQLSIGAKPIRTEFLEAGETTEVNGRSVTGPLDIVRECELGEISFVPLGADGATSAVVSASKRGSVMKKNYKAMLKAAGTKFSDDEIDKMDEETAKAELKKAMKADDPPAEEDDEDEEEETEAKAAAKKASIQASAKEHVKAIRAAEAAEVARIGDIRARVKKHGVTEIEITADGAKRTVNLEAHAIENDWTGDQTELHALRAARPNGVTGPHFYSPSAPQVNDAVLEAAVLQAARHEFKLADDDYYFDLRADGSKRRRVPVHIQRETQRDLKARYTDQVEQAAHSLYKGRIGLQQVLTASATATGKYTGSEVIRDVGDLQRVHAALNWVRAEGASVASIANVLANVQNKMMLQGYLSVEQAWRKIAGIASVKDFKPSKSINLFGDFEYKTVGSSGELEHGSLRDQAFANQAETEGRILTITRTMQINDDLNALTKIPMLMGRGSGLKLNKKFWTEWLDSTNKDNGGSTAFWATTHTITGELGNSNLQSGGSTALQITSLDSANVLFKKQVDPNGDPLGVDAAILLAPVELEGTALELMTSQLIVYGGTTKTPANNVWVNRFEPVISSYLSNSSYTGYSTTAWWLLADPALIPTIEVCFLNGVDVPTVQSAGPDYQFDVLGISIRGFFDSGVTIQNFRGGVKSAGA